MINKTDKKNMGIVILVIIILLGILVYTKIDNRVEKEEINVSLVEK